MTNEEAIKIIEQYDVSSFNFYWTDGQARIHQVPLRDYR